MVEVEVGVSQNDGEGASEEDTLGLRVEVVEGVATVVVLGLPVSFPDSEDVREGVLLPLAHRLGVLVTLKLGEIFPVAQAVGEIEGEGEEETL